MSSFIERLEDAEVIGEHSWRLSDGAFVHELTGVSVSWARQRLQELRKFQKKAGRLIIVPEKLISEENRLFYKRSWAEGEPLRPIIDDDMVERLLTFVASLPPGLIVYDLRPGHIIDTPDGLCLADPGFSLKGTAPYASPEQYGRGEITPAIGYYQLGATLLHLLSGQPPQDAMTLLIPRIEPPLIEQYPSTLAKRFRQLLEAQGSSRPTPQDLLKEFKAWRAFRSETAGEKDREAIKAEHERTVWDEKTEDSELIGDTLTGLVNAKTQKIGKSFRHTYQEFCRRHDTAVTMFGIPLALSVFLGLFLWAEGENLAKAVGVELSAKTKKSSATVSRFPADKALPQSWTCDVDGSRMILIPAGPYYEGPAPEDGVGAEPMITTLPAFYIDRFEVTNRQFIRFVESTGYKSEGIWRKYATPDRLDHPVICVSWHDAQAYAAWAGKRLPTAEEWEKAARGGDARRFPWGNSWNPNYLNCFDSNMGNTAPVGSYPQGASPYGVEDMAGNVWEWVDSWFIPSGSDSSLPMLRQIRGGSRSDKAEDCLIVARRGVFPENGRLVNSGFRCVVDPDHPGVKGEGNFVQLPSLPPGTGYDRSHLPEPEPSPSPSPQLAEQASPEQPDLGGSYTGGSYFGGSGVYGGGASGDNYGNTYPDIPVADTSASREGYYDPSFGEASAGTSAAASSAPRPSGGSAPDPYVEIAPFPDNSAPQLPQSTMKMSSQYTDPNDKELTGDF
ncbi:MAG: SUMF1/EgtB/PvdO family nonheme iron enzyme [bacterium]|nr:SUMF1/EgtB/PvdO family nonheme iron enzyme [bacterium]